MIPAEHVTLALAVVGCIVGIVVAVALIIATAFVVERLQMRRRGQATR